MALVGSDPIERKQVNGTRLLDSSNIPSMSRMTPSAYLVPMDSAMYFFAWAAVLSGTQDLHKDRDAHQAAVAQEPKDELPGLVGDASGG